MKPGPPPGCTPDETPETTCNDGLDNDCDSYIDCDDGDCGGTPACPASPAFTILSLTTNPASVIEGSEAIITAKVRRTGTDNTSVSLDILNQTNSNTLALQENDIFAAGRNEATVEFTVDSAALGLGNCRATATLSANGVSKQTFFTVSEELQPVAVPDIPAALAVVVALCALCVLSSRKNKPF